MEEQRMTTFKWDRLRSNEDYQVLRNAGLVPEQDAVVGWVVKIDGQWVARSASGTVRADFETIDEAKDFLITMINAGANE
jgi:hypothetical protein